MNEKDLDHLIRRALAGEQSLPEGLAERLEQRINRLERKERMSRLRNIGYWTVGIAASALLYFNWLGKGEATDTYANPEEAAQIAVETLAFVSAKLDQGMQQANKAEMEFQKINRILNNP